jgi:hypothetical protein
MHTKKLKFGIFLATLGPVFLFLLEFFPESEKRRIFGDLYGFFPFFEIK